AEDAGIRGGADRAVEVGALDPAVQPDDEREAPDHDRRARDEDPRLPERLAEEAEDPQPEDLAEHPGGELDDIAERREPVARHRQPGHAASPLFAPSIT